MIHVQNCNIAGSTRKRMLFHKIIADCLILTTFGTTTLITSNDLHSLTSVNWSAKKFMDLEDSPSLFKACTVISLISVNYKNSYSVGRQNPLPIACLESLLISLCFHFLHSAVHFKNSFIWCYFEYLNVPHDLRRKRKDLPVWNAVCTKWHKLGLCKSELLAITSRWMSLSSADCVDDFQLPRKHDQICWRCSIHALSQQEQQKETT